MKVRGQLMSNANAEGAQPNIQQRGDGTRETAEYVYWGVGVEVDVAKGAGEKQREGAGSERRERRAASRPTRRAPRPSSSSPMTDTMVMMTAAMAETIALMPAPMADTIEPWACGDVSRRGWGKGGWSGDRSWRVGRTMVADAVRVRDVSPTSLYTRGAQGLHRIRTRYEVNIDITVLSLLASREGKGSSCSWYGCGIWHMTTSRFCLVFVSSFASAVYTELTHSLTRVLSILTVILVLVAWHRKSLGLDLCMLGPRC